MAKNRVTLLGDIANDPSAHTSTAGMAVLSFVLLVEEGYTDTTGVQRDRRSHFPVVAIGRRAEALTPTLRAGQRVLVEGSLRVTTDENREGRTIARAEVVADEVLVVMPDAAAPDEA